MVWNSPLPAIGDPGWGTTLTSAIQEIDTRITGIENTWVDRTLSYVASSTYTFNSENPNYPYLGCILGPNSTYLLNGSIKFTGPSLATGEFWEARVGFRSLPTTKFGIVPMDWVDGVITLGTAGLYSGEGSGWYASEGPFRYLSRARVSSSAIDRTDIFVAFWGIVTTTAAEDAIYVGVDYSSKGAAGFKTGLQMKSGSGMTLRRLN